MSATQASPEERLPLGVKLAFSAPALASVGLTLPIFALMPKFYSDEILAPLGLIAIAIAIARAFDAITDPAMGWISDRVKTPWGRRRPWIVLGAPLTAVAVLALFSPPQELTPNAAALWFGVCFGAYFLGHTIYWVPYGALGYELSMDYNERSSLFGWREAFSLVGTLMAGVTPVALARLFTDERTGYQVVGAIFAVLLIVLFGWLVLRVREREDFVRRAPNPLVPGVRRSLRNRPFRTLLAAYMVFSLTGAIPATVAPFFLQYVLQPEDYGLWLTLTIGGYVSAGIVSIPVWVMMARRFGKRVTWFVSIWVGITGGPGIFFLGEGDMLPFVVLILYTGTNLGAHLVQASMQADVIDYDELHTGKRREAQYASFWAIIPKFVAIPSAAIPLAILAAIGYVPNQVQTAEVQFALRVMLGLAPAAVSLVAFAIALRFRMTEEVHLKIREGLERHRRGEAAQDPLTGEWLQPPGARRLDDDTGWFLDHFSPGEIRRVLREGPARALRDVLSMVALSVVLFAACLAWVADGVQDLSTKPGGAVTLAVVLAGFALTLLVFELLRIRPARRLAAAGISDDVLRAHLAEMGAADATESAREVPVGAAGS